MADEDRSGYVYSGALNRDALAGFLTRRFTGAHAITRRVDRCDAAEIDPAQVESLLDAWDEGQVFNDEAELRWRKTSSGHSTLLLMEKDAPPAGFVKVKDSPFVVVHPSLNETHGFLVWGTRPDDRGHWWEARIPRSLCYPVKTGNKPPRLVYRLYQAAGSVRWVRLVRFVEG